MRRVLNDGMISVGALVVLLMTLVLIDDRVRDQLSQSMRGVSLRGTSAQLGDVGSIVLTAVAEQSMAHAPLAIFVVASSVLVLFMLKT